MRHGKRKPLWPAILGLFSVSLVIAAVIALIVVDPGKPAPVCRYASGSVTVDITGPDCGSVMETISTDTDRAWVTTPASQGGAIFSWLQKGKDVVHIYDHGDPEFAQALANDLVRAHWKVVVPTPAPT